MARDGALLELGAIGVVVGLEFFFRGGDRLAQFTDVGLSEKVEADEVKLGAVRLFVGKPLGFG